MFILPLASKNEGGMPRKKTLKDKYEASLSRVKPEKPFSRYFSSDKKELR